MLHCEHVRVRLEESWAAEIGLVDKRVKVGVPGQGWGRLTLNA